VIFVTVGGSDFDALVQAMDAIAARLDEEVVMQIGRGRYVPHHATYFRYAPDLTPYYDVADIIVAHGGVGTTMEALRHGKRLVSVDNPDRPDHHQEDLLGHLAARGHLVWCRDLGTLERALQAAREQSPVPYQEPPCRIPELVAEFLEQLEKKP